MPWWPEVPAPRTLHLELLNHQASRVGSFDDIPHDPPQYTLAVAVAAALFEDGAEQPLWCVWGDEPPFVTRPATGSMNPRQDMRPRRRWRSGPRVAA